MKSILSFLFLFFCFLTSRGQGVPDSVNGNVLTVVEEPASPSCGMGAFYKTIGNGLKYPKEAKDKGVTGKVFVEFVVNEQGLFSDVRALKGIGSGCDEEAVRIVTKSNKNCPWRPAKRGGVAIKTRFVVPVKFGVK